MISMNSSTSERSGEETSQKLPPVVRASSRTLSGHELKELKSMLGEQFNDALLHLTILRKSISVLRRDYPQLAEALKDTDLSVDTALSHAQEGVLSAANAFASLIKEQHPAPFIPSSSNVSACPVACESLN